MHFFFLYKEKRKLQLKGKIRSNLSSMWALPIEDPMSLVNNLSSIVHSADANKEAIQLARV